MAPALDGAASASTALSSDDDDSGDAGADLATDVDALIAGSTSLEWQKRGQRARAAFSAYLGSLGQPRPTWATASPEHCRTWLVHLFRSDRPDLDRGGLATTTVIGYGSALDHARRASGLAPFMVEQRTRALLQALRRERPVGRLAPPLPRAPLELVAHLPRGDDFASVRLRALLGVRTAALLRPSSPLDIDLSTIAHAVSPAGARVVVFRLRSSKGAAIAGRISDANYVEYLPVDCANLFACPGTNLLALATEVKRLAAQRGLALPPTPFVVESTLQPLSSDRVSKLIKNLMMSAGWEDARSHDLRAAANATLQALGVPTDDVCTRGGWSSAINATRVDHYSSFRFVQHNFAQLLLGGARVMPVVGHEAVEGYLSD